jgi:Flp pilus assembly protein protease CpaA
MLGWLLLTVGVAGFGWAGFSDLRTTEFRDEIPYALITAALVIRGLAAIFTNDVSIFLNSLVYGILFLGFGILLYHLNQWGDGDAWLLGALGFLFPDPAGFSFNSVLPFPLALIFNFLFISFAYLIVYSIAVGVTSGVGGAFFHELKGGGRGIFGATLVFALVIFGAVAYLLKNGLMTPELSLFWPLLASPFLLFGMLVFVRYGRFIETRVFRKRIPVSKLKVGDVPVNQKWKVMTRSEFRMLKSRGGSVWIKEGVRFAPVFIITLVITLFYGALFI